MSGKPIIFIAGLGRCGTTMVMNMLWRGGFPVAGEAPAFETDHMLGSVDTAWLRDQAGRAVKWIDPLNASISRTDLSAEPAIIILRRDPKEQARSQLKLLALTGVPVRTDRNMVRAMSRSITEDARRMESQLPGIGACYDMTFEGVLANPYQAAHTLGTVIRQYFGATFDTESAAAVVLARSPICALDLSVEINMGESVTP